MAVDVSVVSVKSLLDDVASNKLADATVTANINRSRRIIEDVKDPLAKDTRVEDAIRAIAVWLSYGSYTEGITQQLGNISVADEVKLNHFRKVAELFLNQVSKESMGLDIDFSDQTMIGLPPEVAALTTSEAYKQST